MPAIEETLRTGLFCFRQFGSQIVGTVPQAQDRLLESLLDQTVVQASLDVRERVPHRKIEFPRRRQVFLIDFGGEIVSVPRPVVPVGIADV